MHSRAKETKEPDSLANLFDFLKEKDSGLRNRTVIYWPATWGAGMASFLQERGIIKDGRHFDDYYDFWEWIHNNEFDRIVMDIWKDDKGKHAYNVDIIRQIRNDFPDCKIIVTSALNHFQVFAFFLGADALFTLPFSMEELVSIFND